MEIEEKIKLAEKIIQERKDYQEILKIKINELNSSLIQYSLEISSVEAELNKLKQLFKK